ncbi:MAG: response regulator transcription factor, partial [Actinobacteria bacterium]|nr:response regulator transcription factor [Actinomycetota bacterium]
SAEHYGAIAAHGSLIFALLGQTGEAERWVAAAERASPAGILPDGSTMEGTLAYLRAVLCRDGVAEMRHDARIARDGLSPASPYQATMLYTEGLSYLLDGDRAQAGPILVRALDVSAHVGAPPLTALILVQQCNLAAQRKSWSEVTSLAERAVAIVEAGNLGDYWTSALVYAWAARAALHQGDGPQGRFYLGRASRLRPLLTYMLPVVSVQALLEMARSYIKLADRGGAAAVLTQAQGILQQRPDLGLLPAQAGRLQARLDTVETRAAGPSALTAAELRLLPLLSTHLPVSEIAAELFLSPHTVKSEMKSIYRKLGATTRTQAVTRSRELGLLGL